MKFSVSVIIPVYNCESFIEKAIESVLLQPEVFEIIVVNDGSTDDSLSLIEALQKEDDRIKIYHHKNAVNKGRSATRNLGIQKATGNYIAFLDADDYYLENRFTNDKIVFEQNTDVDGVYNAIGVHFYRDIDILEQNELKLYTVKAKTKSNQLFETLFFGNKGHFSIIGLTVKKSVFNSIGYFNEFLMVMEDTELFYKMALKCNLETGIIKKPLAIRGVHDANIFNKKDYYRLYRIKVYESLFLWCCKNDISVTTIDIILKRLWTVKYKEEPSLLKNIGFWNTLFFKNPKQLFSITAVKYFPVIRLRRKLFPFLFRS